MKKESQQGGAPGLERRAYIGLFTRCPARPFNKGH